MEEEAAIMRRIGSRSSYSGDGNPRGATCTPAPAHRTVAAAAAKSIDGLGWGDATLPPASELLREPPTAAAPPCRVEGSECDETMGGREGVHTDETDAMPTVGGVGASMLILGTPPKSSSWSVPLRAAMDGVGGAEGERGVRLEGESIGPGA